ncbi:MAG TPA: hypothetical protein VD769_01185 [Gaiellaceae bacterium]|nr:hypothetical protein [Gaiellaceae bacterium]
MRSARVALALVFAAVVLAACGGGDDETTEPGATTVTTTIEVTTTEPAPTTAPTTTEAAPPGPPFSTAPARAAAGSTRLALLTDVRLGRHEGYDRIVLEFLPGSRPGYRVRYVSPPIVEDASGMVVEVDGGAFLSIRIEPASGFDLTGELGEVYTGPRRIAGSSTGTEVVVEVVRTGDFEGVLNWVAGLDERMPFRVARLAGPPRIVVDVRT